MATNFVCHRCYLDSIVSVEELTQEETLINIPPTASSDSYYLRIHFNLNIQEQRWYIPPDDHLPQQLVHTQSQCSNMSSRLLLRPLSDKRLYRTISQMIVNLYGKFEHYHIDIVEDTIRRLREKESNKDCRILEVSVDETSTIYHICDGRILFVSADGMVPASKLSIELLEPMEDHERNINDECMVCLEEIGEETQVLGLPCSHMFHAECITEWLEKSHYCPLCRYELPTEYSSANELF